MKEEQKVKLDLKRAEKKSVQMVETMSEFLGGNVDLLKKFQETSEGQVTLLTELVQNREALKMELEIKGAYDLEVAKQLEDNGQGGQQKKEGEGQDAMTKGGPGKSLFGGFGGFF